MRVPVRTYNNRKLTFIILLHRPEARVASDLDLYGSNLMVVHVSFVIILLQLKINYSLVYK